jgi:protease-4
MPPPPPPRSGGRALLIVLLLGSILLNILLCGAIIRGVSSDESNLNLRERFVAGSPTVTDRVAVVRVDGVLMEGMLSYPHRQIDQAAEDKDVKAVVLRIESPGGTITSSDDLLKRLGELRDGTSPRFKNKGTTFPKPLVVSMGSIAASGGYYIAMAAAQDPNKPQDKMIFAERSTLTGSIGVYASFPNVSELTHKYGIKMELIRAGDIKGSGSPFHEMSPQERQPWQDMVEHAYAQFLGVVADGRPALKGKMTQDLFPPRDIPERDDKGDVVKVDGREKTAKYTRKRADGGVFTADEAKKYGLIDEIGTLEDAVKEAARQASLSDYRAVVYEKPLSILSALTGGLETSARPAGQIDFKKLADRLGPRVWYLLPQAEMGAWLDALGRE